MGKKLAIKGHSTRGKEVIELLEMMGGINDREYIGTNTWKDEYYFLDNGYIRAYDWCDGIKFTLEEFLWKYPFKVGDKVMDGKGNSLTIKSMSWSADCETMVYDFKDSVIVLAAEDLLKYNAEFLVNKEKGEEMGRMLCDMTLNHLHRISLKNVLAELLEHIKTTPKEDLEREFEEIKEWTNVGPTVEEFRTFCECVNNMNDAGLKIENMNMNIEFDLTKYSYEVKNGKLVVSEKKPKYPKTFRECRAILNDMEGNISGYKASILAGLQDLFICRNAYWKIAGEEMGLDKPWEPDWNDEIQKYCIRTDRNKIVNCSSSFNNRILAFPTEEMRDAFYENFKDLIEECKELL